MALRSAHGNGAGALARAETLPADEQPKAQAAGPDPIATGRDAAGKVRSSAAAKALAKLPRRSRFVPRRIACDPRFEGHNRRRLEWQRKRLAELAAAHGGVSHGVGAMLSAAAWLYAAGECAAEVAAETLDFELFRAAANLSNTARQHELTAWELSAREAAARAETGDDLSRQRAAFQRQLAERNGGGS
jgi:hypothetical protein